MMTVYKICRAVDWARAREVGAYEGSPDDRRDGFIHLSANHQVSETARRHFSGESGLILVAFEAEALGSGLRWEPSRDGDLFPHHYGTIPTAAAMWIAPLPWRDGNHQFPAELP
jgi:uncharacterized protein (DUF952 family)